MKELLHCSYLSLNFAMNQWIVVMDEHLSMLYTALGQMLPHTECEIV